MRQVGPHTKPELTCLLPHTAPPLASFVPLRSGHQTLDRTPEGSFR